MNPSPLVDETAAMTARAEQLLQHIRRWASAAVTPPESDAALLDHFIHHRDEESFAALVRRHGPMVLGVCRRILGDAHDAEDAFQAAFLVLARKAASVKPRHALAAFLYGVARRVALKARTANIRRTRGVQPLTTTPADPHASPLDDLSARELLAIFEEELQRLPAAYRLPLILCCLEGRSQEEAARQLGWTPGSVKGRLERGRARLHARLTRRGVTLAAALMAAETLRGIVAGGLSASTVKAGLLFASGPVEGTAAVLAEGALRGMAWSKGTLLAGLLTMTLTFAGAGVVTHQMLAGGTPETPKQAGTPPAQPEGKPHPRLDRHGDPLPEGAIARLGTLRFRGVRGCLAFSPDGKWLATATGPAGERVTIWDAATGREVRQSTIAGGGTLRRLVFSPDGRRLLLMDNSRSCRIVDVETDEKLLELEGTDGAFSADGKAIVTCLAGETSLVRSWDALTGKALLTKEFAINIHEFAVAGDGRTLAVTDKRLVSEVKVLDLAKGTVVRSFRLAGSGQPRLSLTADGKTLASADFNAVRLWDMSGGQMLDSWNCRNLGGSAVFSPDGKRLAWTSLDEKGGSHRLWVVECHGGKPRPVGAPVHNFETPCFSPDGKRLAIVTDASVLSLRNVADGKEAPSFDAANRPVTDLAFDADGRHVLSRGDEVFAWQTRTGKLLHREALLPPGHEYLVPLLPGGHLLTGERTSNPLQGRFWLRDARTGEDVMRFDGRPDVGPPAAIAAPGGRYVGVRGRAGEICVLDVAARRCAYSVDPEGAAFGLKLSADGDVLAWYRRVAGGIEVYVHRHAAGKTIVLRDLPKGDHVERSFVNCSCVSPDGRWLILATEEGRLRRWDLTTGKEAAPLIEALRTTWELIWSPDGRFVAAQGAASPANVIDHEARRDLRVWDVRTGARLAHLTVPNHQGGMHVHFTHDGRTMLTTDLQGVIHLWEVTTGKERMRLKGHLSYAIGSLALSADDRILVSGGYDSQALVWDLTGRTPDGQWRTVRHPPEKLRVAWKALASEDAKAAYAVMWQLIADPEGTTALLRQQLRPVARPEAGQVARLIAVLDSESFAERERATRELETLEEAATAELRQSLTRKPSLEVRRRVEALLERLNKPPIGAQLQALRAIEVLEHIGTPGARQLLKTLAEGISEAQTTREAKAALARLERGSQEQP